MGLFDLPTPWERIKEEGKKQEARRQPQPRPPSSSSGDDSGPGSSGIVSQDSTSTIEVADKPLYAQTGVLIGYERFYRARYAEGAQWTRDPRSAQRDAFQAWLRSTSYEKRYPASDRTVVSSEKPGLPVYLPVKQQPLPPGTYQHEPGGAYFTGGGGVVSRFTKPLEQKNRGSGAGGRAGSDYVNPYEGAAGLILNLDYDRLSQGWFGFQQVISPLSTTQEKRRGAGNVISSYRRGMEQYQPYREDRWSMFKSPLAFTLYTIPLGYGFGGAFSLLAQTAPRGAAIVGGVVGGKMIGDTVKGGIKTYQSGGNAVNYALQAGTQFALGLPGFKLGMKQIGGGYERFTYERDVLGYGTREGVRFRSGLKASDYLGHAQAEKYQALDMGQLSRLNTRTVSMLDRFLFRRPKTVIGGSGGAMTQAERVRLGRDADLLVMDYGGIKGVAKALPDAVRTGESPLGIANKRQVQLAKDYFGLSRKTAVGQHAVDIHGREMFSPGRVNRFGFESRYPVSIEGRRYMQIQEQLFRKATGGTMAETRYRAFKDVPDFVDIGESLIRSGRGSWSPVTRFFTERGVRQLDIFKGTFKPGELEALRGLRDSGVGVRLPRYADLPEMQGYRGMYRTARPYIISEYGGYPRGSYRIGGYSSGGYQAKYTSYMPSGYTKAMKTGYTPPSIPRYVPDGKTGVPGYTPLPSKPGPTPASFKPGDYTPRITIPLPRLVFSPDKKQGFESEGVMGKEEGGLKRGYNVLVKDRVYVHGKKKLPERWVRVSSHPLSRSDALSLGGSATDNSAAASFKIQRASDPARPLGFSVDNWSFIGDKFIEKKGRYIERTDHRIDSQGEIAGISARGWVAHQRGISTTRVKPMKTVSIEPMRPVTIRVPDMGRFMKRMAL